MRALDFCKGFAAIVLLAGCTGTASSPEPEREPGPDVSLSFIQQRVDEGTARAQLRVVNHEDQDLHVTGVGLDWAGYGGRLLRPYDTVVPAGRTLDLRIVLPPPACDPADGPVRGLLEIGGTTVRSVLDASGTGFVRRIWSRACAEQAVRSAVGLSYGNVWRRDGDALVGTVELRRREGDELVRLTGLTGSVLFELRLPDPVVLAPGRARSVHEVRLRPGRCDEHAWTESSQSFLFRGVVRIGSGEALPVVLVPDGRVQAKAFALLRDACR